MCQQRHQRMVAREVKQSVPIDTFEQPLIEFAAR
jgi:hypothetical protein